MIWGIEYFMGLNIFVMGWVSVLVLSLFLFLFGYFGLRASEKEPAHKSLELTAYTMVVALFLAFTSIPSFCAGIVLVVAYTLISRYMFKQKIHKFSVSFVALWLLLFIFALLPDEWRIIMMVFSVIYFFISSEIDVKRKKREEKTKK
ncbi:MAG: hypothetical protein NTY48_03540 [Candidatus Diapherotrites archaeon]|nr:hypothetical protein [Candidatus Diapherotrites archaeon]